MLELLDQYQRLEIALKLSRGRKRRLNEVGMQVAVYCLVTRPKGQKVLEVDAGKAVVVRRLFELRYIFKIGHLPNWRNN